MFDFDVVTGPALPPRNHPEPAEQARQPQAGQPAGSSQGGLADKAPAGAEARA
ncbi:hypothetical protein [Arenibaculum pallidiluteum]|uniref:hypothetical protein n=1 Tax=Arenibaculum pallidiluteum TaxID=2812559 RepID=UPI001A962AD0|nr:hypothetical protein [Arenibaculum pallidiluteum]